jgi:hypothetical protein
VVVKEVRPGAALGKNLSRNFIEFERGDTGTNRGASCFVHLGDHFAGLAHLVQLVG